MQSNGHIDDATDEASRESFPASDPPAVHPDDTVPANAPDKWEAAAVRAAAATREGRVSEALAAGAAAPAFSLPVSPSTTAALSDYRGRPVVLVFYPADWSPVCGDQLALYTELQDEFSRLGAQVLGISVDGPWCHAAFAAARHYAIPLLSDFEPKGAVARSYGVYAAEAGTTERALFVIDAQGVIRWSYVSPMEVNPGADGILAALESLRDAAP
ncbi:MAG TPA: redoxin domain-containing protein [Steroidobacteraceae bacterium]|nr:redoxin domain-containing protein [Steroidobacteraceae bacterium]